MWIDEKYCNLISIRLPLFHVKKTNPYQANFRCIFCGDSKKSLNKCRGYFITKKEGIVYHCHNCGIHMWLSQLLKQIDFGLYKQYMAEKFVDSDVKKKFYEPNPNDDFKKPKFITESPLRVLKKISQLNNDHPAKQYVLKRKLLNPTHAKLFYCPKFFAWVNTIIPDKFEVYRDEPRLVIPFIDKEQNLFGFQGRSFDPKATTKYFTIMLDESMPKVYNLDTVDFSKRTYITEGPIDAMFLPNSIAMAGADLTFRNLDIIPANSIMVFDNEPRNLEMVKRAEKVIELGFNIFIWPNSVIQKDINEMICADISAAEIVRMIDTNSFSGFVAYAKLSEWKRC